MMVKNVVVVAIRCHITNFWLNHTDQWLHRTDKTKQKMRHFSRDYWNKAQWQNGRLLLHSLFLVVVVVVHSVCFCHDQNRFDYAVFGLIHIMHWHNTHSTNPHSQREMMRYLNSFMCLSISFLVVFFLLVYLFVAITMTVNTTAYISSSIFAMDLLVIWTPKITDLNLAYWNIHSNVFSQIEWVRTRDI